MDYKARVHGHPVAMTHPHKHQAVSEQESLVKVQVLPDTAVADKYLEKIAI